MSQPEVGAAFRASPMPRIERHGTSSSGPIPHAA
jgi:hypothetical protein